MRHFFYCCYSCPFLLYILSINGSLRERQIQKKKVECLWSTCFWRFYSFLFNPMATIHIFFFFSCSFFILWTLFLRCLIAQSMLCQQILAFKCLFCNFTVKSLLIYEFWNSQKAATFVSVYRKINFNYIFVVVAVDLVGWSGQKLFATTKCCIN